MQGSSVKLSGIHILLIAAVLVTAVIHLGLGSDFLVNIGDIMFLLNGLGYIGLAALFLIPIARLKPYHETIRWVLVGFTALTILLWVIFGMRNLEGYVAKLAEVAIIVVLIVDRPKK